MKKIIFFSVIIITGLFLYNSAIVYAQQELPDFLKDRGTGIATSMFGTYANN